MTTANTNRVVVTYSVGAAGTPDGHGASTRKELARRLAAFMGSAYEGEYDPRRGYAGLPYFVPSDALTSEAASRLGIRSECDLFGGVVPHPFVATKTITHPLVDAASRVPAGWSTEFPRRVADVVLDGFGAFAKEDALLAGRRLLNADPFASNALQELPELANSPRTTSQILPARWTQSTKKKWPDSAWPSSRT